LAQGHVQADCRFQGQALYQFPPLPHLHPLCRLADLQRFPLQVPLLEERSSPLLDHHVDLKPYSLLFFSKIFCHDCWPDRSIFNQYFPQKLLDSLDFTNMAGFFILKLREISLAEASSSKLSFMTILLALGRKYFKIDQFGEELGNLCASAEERDLTNADLDLIKDVLKVESMHIH
jgi:hypothetical protein